MEHIPHAQPRSCMLLESCLAICFVYKHVCIICIYYLHAQGIATRSVAIDYFSILQEENGIVGSAVHVAVINPRCMRERGLQ